MNDFKSYSQREKSRSAAGAGDGAVGGTGMNGGGNTADDMNGGYGDYSDGVRKNDNSAGGADLKQTADMMTMMARAFGGKSEAQVFKTILAQAEEGKRNGTLTNADIDNFYNTIAPMLDGFRRKKLKEIIARLKAI